MVPAVKPLRLDGRHSAANVEVCGWGRPPITHHRARAQDRALGTSGAPVSAIISTMDDAEFELRSWDGAGDEPPYEDRIHDALIEGFGVSDRGTTAANSSGGGSHNSA